MMSSENEARHWNGVDTGLVIACVLCFAGGFFSPGFFGLSLAAGSAEMVRYQGRKSDKALRDFMNRPTEEILRDLGANIDE